LFNDQDGLAGCKKTIYFDSCVGGSLAGSLLVKIDNWQVIVIYTTYKALAELKFEMENR
jgi:hypothetical protein